MISNSANVQMFQYVDGHIIRKILIVNMFCFCTFCGFYDFYSVFPSLFRVFYSLFVRTYFLLYEESGRHFTLSISGKGKVFAVFFSVRVIF